jgi:PLP dependent protein
LTDASDSEAIAQNVQSVLHNIRQAADRVGRQSDTIRLIAVTKSVSASRIRHAVAAGVRLFGENRLQEALPKIASFGAEDGLGWHFIGRLQRRKARSVVGAFVMIQSVDSLELAAEINRRAEEAGVCQEILLELNIGGESTKAGFSLSAVVDALPVLDSMSHLSVKGLMAVPPPTREAESARLYFRRLSELARSLSRPDFRRVRMDELSMGMSNDYETAVEEGATFVRVGTAIFGPRPR